MDTFATILKENFCLDRVSHSGRSIGEYPPSNNFFQNSAPLIETDAPPWGTPPPLEREAPFHEMIPRKSTVNNNLKSS